MEKDAIQITLTDTNWNKLKQLIERGIDDLEHSLKYEESLYNDSEIKEIENTIRLGKACLAEKSILGLMIR